MLALASPAFAGEPREVAESAMRAWVSHDAKLLHSLSHPELIARMRQARVIQFYLERHPEKISVPKSGSDADVVALLCEALAAVVPPRDGRFIYEDRYLDTQEAGDLAVVTFESSVTSAGDAKKAWISPTAFALRKKEGQWLFLWSPAVRIHVDMDWDPRP